MATLIGVPALALASNSYREQSWASVDQIMVQSCVAAQSDGPTHPDAITCAKRSGAFAPEYKREGKTASYYWCELLAACFLIDLTISAFVALSAVTIHWIWRGFRISPSS
ncbi:MAG: hypothetical protein JOY99_11075 [Sphingomonadaceae bacterium]|nr:hypothetical protein [Sphingomonadaceae bacterium]